jgi:uncharacterized circularly permuted ATP-grasp superfamily protein
MGLDQYDRNGFFDEMFGADGSPWPWARYLKDCIEQLPQGELARRQVAAERALFDMGITFNVYGDSQATERIFPFDLVPRMIHAKEWDRTEEGLKQRITALNLFIDDVYHDQKILKDGVVPREIVESAEGYLPACQGINPPLGVWCHITGTDLVRDDNGQFMVLEDNLRCPSGVSYVLANREQMKRTFPEVFAACRVRPVAHYPGQLLKTLSAVAPQGIHQPVAALLTPGRYNSAYFEHSFLAQQMGCELIESNDLVVSGGVVCMKTTRGLQRVDVIYRRVNDDFLDPQVFRPDSVLGVPGIMEVYRQGRVNLVNAPGTGVADDKVIYAYVPRIIKYYLDQDPIIPNVETYMCWEDASRDHVLGNLDKLVVKAANEAGGYGMLIGPHSTEAKRKEFADLIRSKPRNYIAQPTLKLSRAPVIVEDHLEGRHVDLRPFILYGERIYVLPGGLTRVALKKDSLVVNSSQGGGSKDTWVAEWGEE